MHRAWLAAAFVLLATAASACGSPPPAAPPVAPAPPDPHNPSIAPPSASSDPDVVGDNPAKPRGRKPFPIHSSCPDVVTIVFGDDPKALGAGRRTIATNSSIEGPRDAEGKP